MAISARKSRSRRRFRAGHRPARFVALNGPPIVTGCIHGGLRNDTWVQAVTCKCTQPRQSAHSSAHFHVHHRDHLLPPVHMSPAGKIAQPTPGPFSAQSSVRLHHFSFLFSSLPFPFFFMPALGFSRAKMSRQKFLFLFAVKRPPIRGRRIN